MRKIKKLACTVCSSLPKRLFLFLIQRRNARRILIAHCNLAKRSHHSYHLWLVRYIKYINLHYPGLQSTVVFDGYHNQYKSTKYHKRIWRYRLRWSADINLAIFNPQNVVDNIQLETHLIHNLILKLPFWHLICYFLFSTKPRHQRATVSLTEMGRRGRCEAAGRAGIRGWPVDNNL